MLHDKDRVFLEISPEHQNSVRPETNTENDAVDDGALPSAGEILMMCGDFWDVCVYLEA